MDDKPAPQDPPLQQTWEQIHEERLNDVKCWVVRSLAPKRWKSYSEILRWLLESGDAVNHEIEISAIDIAGSFWVHSGKRTVQRALAFFVQAGILQMWGRCDESGAPLPPGGRLLWDTVLRQLGREPEGTVPPTVSLDGRRRGQGTAAPTAASCRQPPQRSLPGVLRDPQRIKSCVYSHRIASPEVTSLVDDEGRVRTVGWPEVQALAAKAQTIVRRGLTRSVHLRPLDSHAVAWLSLAVFSPHWLELSCEAMREKLRGSRDPVDDPTRYLLGILRQNLAALERLPRFGDDKELRVFFSAICYAIEPWIRARLAEEAARQAKPEAAPASRPRATRPMTAEESQQWDEACATTEFGREYLRRRAKHGDAGAVPQTGPGCRPGRSATEPPSS